MGDRVYRDIPPSAWRDPDGSWDVDPGYSAEEQARDDWLDEMAEQLGDDE